MVAMTTEEFVQMRAQELRGLVRVWFGRPWRRAVAREMCRWDAPRFLVARPGRHRVTLAQLVPVEKLMLKKGISMGCPRFSVGRKRCPEDAGQVRGNLPPAD